MTDQHIVTIDLPVRRPQVRSLAHGEYQCECGNEPALSGFSPAAYLGRGQVEIHDEADPKWDGITWFCCQCGGIFSGDDVKPVAA